MRAHGLVFQLLELVVCTCGILRVIDELLATYMYIHGHIDIYKYVSSW